jgi:hypothetical protein
VIQNEQDEYDEKNWQNITLGEVLLESKELMSSG